MNQLTFLNLQTKGSLVAQINREKHHTSGQPPAYNSEIIWQSDITGDVLIHWLSRQHRDQKRKEARDKKLREELAVKAQEFSEPTRQAIDEYTELTINGVRQKIQVDRITLVDVIPQTAKS